MTKEDIKELVSGGEYKGEFVHKLSQLVCVLEDDYEGDIEITYTVPYDYAKNYFEMTEEEYDTFIEQEYTSEDSWELLCDAALNKQLVNIKY